MRGPSFDPDGIVYAHGVLRWALLLVALALFVALAVLALVEAVLTVASVGFAAFAAERKASRG